MPISGKYGAVAGNSGVVISDIKQWLINQTTDGKSYSASNLNGGTNRRPGLTDWTGNFVRNAIYPGLLLMPGDNITPFLGYLGNGVQPNAAAITAVGNGYIDNINIVWNWESNELQTITYNIASQGSILVIGSGQVHDTSDPTGAVQSANAVLQIATDADAYAAYNVICVKQATLNILSNPQASATSCNVIAGPPTYQTQSRVPGLFDWNLSLTMDAILTPPFSNSLFAPGSYIAVRIVPDNVNDATKYWELKYGYVNDLANFTVNIETGEIISYTYNISMSADGGFGSSENSGNVLYPDASGNQTWWPVAAAA